jgi:hypothetical protein
MPRVPMTRFTRFALLSLQVYLAIMLALIVYKFYHIIVAGQLH